MPAPILALYATGALSIPTEPGADDRNVVDDIPLLLNPARPGLRSERLGCLLRFGGGELADDVHGLFRAHELPDPVRAEQHEAPSVFHLVCADLWHAAHTSNGAHRVTDGARHGEARVHLAMQEHPVGDVTLQAADLAARCLDALAFGFAGGLVVARQVLGLELAVAAPREDSAGVADVRHVEHAAVVQRQRRCGPAQRAV
mmetsp:Transcript_12398/g.25192  ORF Transcript_12398/g.25192 Transcript_12398/m.25192 type:complete len:201 (+) Transcript_12398:253-855(+)